MRTPAAIVALLAFSALSASAADGPEAPHGAVLLVRGAHGEAWQPVPALATDVEIRVAGVVVRARVAQRFRNPTDRWLEAVYRFPLPESAAVDHLELRAGGRVIEGEIREREAAEEGYREAKADGRRASLLEQQRPDVFTLSVANLGPGEDVEVSLEYQDAVRYDAAGFRLRFPTVVAPRYAGGAADAAELAPPVLHASDGPLNPVRLRVELDAGLPLERVVSPSHVVHVEDLGPGRHRIVLGDYADRDFVLEWKPAPGEGPRAVLLGEERGRDGYVLLLLVPPEGPEAAGPAERLSREVVFVIDTSGSMAGPSIEQARRALRLAVDRLAPGDRFEVIRFDDETEALFGGVVPADESHLERARAFVEGLDADGGTEMLPALRAALADDAGAGDIRQVVFVTDGCIGNEEALFEAIRGGLGRSRLFTVGIGSAPNGHFLTGVAALGRGTHTFVANPAEVDEKMGALLEKLERPVVSDVEVLWNDAVEQWPARVPDLYAGEPVVVTARVPRFVGDVRVRGRRAGLPFEARVPLATGALAPGAPERGIAVLFARRKIDALLADRAQDPAAARAAVVAVALEHHLVSPFTSLVAVDATPARPEGEALQRADVPANLPAGADAVKIGAVLPRAGTPGPLLRLLGALLLAAGLAVALVARPARTA
jgi:Ca-activated chloride channel family protein